MKITTRGFYAVEVMRALASWDKSLPMSIADIEEKTGIPRDYIARLLLRLKHADLAESFRGNAGGYRIAKKPKDISLVDVFTAVGEDIAPWPATPRSYKRRPLICPIHPVWQRLYTTNKSFLEKTSLTDFL
ncbi:MAG: Rrf2 family transcriptional regulator [bacterium]|nr:Rrf2 family transcriptional regulator [bacterium]